MPQVISPLRVESDRNGVNLLNGKIQLQGPALSVPAAPNLTFDRVQNLAPYLSGTRSGGSGDYVEGSYSIHTGRGTSESFRCTYDDQCVSVAGTGSTFAPGANMFTEAGTGAVWRFDLKQYETATNPVNLQYYASSVAYPNGETISYSYYTATDSWGRTFYRPVRISSNLGYFITVAYHSSELYTHGWSAPSQAAIYSDADPATPLGRLTYSLDGSSITDITGRTFSCQGCPNSVGGELEVASGSLQLHGEGAPTVQVAQTSGAQVVSTVTRDGVQWNYSYTNLRLDSKGANYIYDRLTVTGPDGFNAVYDVQQRYGTDGGLERNIITRSTDPISRATAYEYDTGYRTTRIMLPEGNRVDVSYDSSGNIVTRTTTPKPNSGLAAIS